MQTNRTTQKLFIIVLNLRDISGAIEGGVEPRLDIAPGALVLVLFLSPAELSIGVLSTLFLHKIEWEWRNLNDITC